MHQQLHPYFLLLITITFILIYIPGSLCQDDEQFSKCGEPLRCGNMDIDYPFWGKDRPNYCGGHSSFEIKCENDIPKIAFESTKYKVIGIHNPSRILTLARDDLLSNNICLDRPENDSLDLNTFSYVSSDQNITLYFRCSLLGGFQMPTSYRFTCSGNLFGIYTVGSPFDLTSVTCQNQIIVRVNRTNAVALDSDKASEQLLKTAIAGGFSVSWMPSIDSKCLQCDISGGRCGSNPSFTAFACHCADGTHPTDCNDGQNQGGANLLSTIFHYLLESMD